MKSNAAFTNKCYKIQNTQLLFEKLILEIKKGTNNNMSIFVIPQLSDLKKNNSKGKISLIESQPNIVLKFLMRLIS